MASYGQSFESAESIEERKEYKRKAREDVLRKAKEKYEQEERRQELKRARGEDTWMLPEVDLRLQQLDKEHSGKSKKKKEKKSKKSKKEKKKKAKKEKKTSKEDDSSDSSEDSEEQWVEAQPQPEISEKAWKIPSEKSPAASNLTDTSQRDAWMTFDFLSMKTTSTAERRAEKEQKKEAEREKARSIEEAGLHKLELNPYWKDGGTGLPPEEGAGAPVKKAALVDDGGLSWLRKSYQRMKEQAEREQRSLEAVVAERYGSMEQFQKRLEEAEKAAYGQRRAERESGGERWRRRSPNVSQRRFERDRESSPSKGNEDVDRERGRSEGRGPRRDRNADGARDPRGDREGRPRDRQADDGDRRHRDDRRPHRDSLPGASRRDEPPPSLGSLKARFLKPSEREDDVGTGWGRKREAAPASGRSSSGFLKPSDEDGESDHGRTPAWKKAISSRDSREPEPKSDSVKSAEMKGTPADLRDFRAGDSLSQQHQQRESGTALVKSHSPMETSPRDPGGPARSSESEEEEEEVQILSDEELNKLGAKLVKAELMGNTALVEKLKAQLAAARKAKESRAQKGQPLGPPGKMENKVLGRAHEEQEVVLFRTDQAGRAWPVNAPSEPPEPKGGRRKRKAIETHRDGERVRYFQDDDKVDLQEMVRREKMSTAEDQNALYSRMAAKMMGKQDGDNYTLDDMFVSSAAQRERSGQDEERQRHRAVQEHRRWASSMEKCPYCFDSKELPKHLIVAIGVKVYLCLPNSVSLVEGHCLIAPMQHHCAATGLDEDVWSEIQMFRKALVKMFEDQDQDCVFLETHMNPKRRHHMVYECIPLPRELGDMAPIYFKKAIMESDEEWAMNKKLVDLSSKDVRCAVPKGLPYFSVDFGLQGGFAHIIENEQKFPHYFGKEILGGMLDLEPRRWRKPIRENFDDQRKKVLQFAKWWKPFDCTITDS
ncbi:CWF19-like protein 2 isoform X2 [Megalops cyprinoides]|uniref:CWF19-like protein 2 isoform X2 n=1 Tax=Megalops cyprinoides TaxID=118141 RepID=UPI001864C990|nr:CWF19-like protein 2 isoform X2 [Megalops cyprinoides]